jgi:ComF family protein
VGDSRYIERVFSGYQYAGILPKIIPAWKYHNRNEFFPLIQSLIELMIPRLRMSDFNFDLVMAIPLSRKSLKQRHFNQALFIASVCSSFLKIPLLKHQIVKVVETPHQASLDRQHRVNNLDRNTFKILAPEMVAGRKIILCDDVMTTGSTLKVAAEVLKCAGAATVSALTLARVE